MKLYKLSLLALALTAGAFTSCSDDDDYVVGAQSEGVYFSNTMSSTVILNSEATTAAIPVMRTNTDGSESVTLSVTDESGLFTIPATVSFNSGSNTADISITYDPSKLETDRPYPVTFAVPDGSQTLYGQSKLTVNLVMKSPVIEKRGPNGTYMYTLFFSGTDPDLPTTISYSDKTPNLQTYTIHNWGYGVDLKIEVDFDKVFDDGTVACYVPEQYIGYDIADGPVYIADMYSYTGSADYEDVTYYDPQTGLFSLGVYYHIADGRGWDPGYEYFQLDGFPDYSVGVTYDGVFITAGGKKTYAIATVDVADDVEQAIVANIAGNPTEDTLDEMLGGAIPTETLGTGLGQEVRFEIDGSGNYTLVVLAVVKDEVVNVATASYKVELGGGDDPQTGNWETIGYAPYVDGWVTCAFVDNPFENAFWVEIQQNTEDENLICMHNPYEGLSINDGNGKANIIFDLSDPELIPVVPQYSGFDLLDSGLPWGDEWYVGNYEGLLMAFGATDLRTELWNDYMRQPEVEGATIADVLIDMEANTCLIDEGIYVPVPLIGGAEEFGYTWNSGYPCVIYLSELTDSPSNASARVRMAKAQANYAFKHTGFGKVKTVYNTPAKAKKAVRNNIKLSNSANVKLISKRKLMK